MKSRQAKKELSKAVANFNKVKNKLEKEEKKIMLPETIDFRSLNKRIITRENLNETVRELKQFGKGNSLDIYETYSGEKITLWEHEKLEKEKIRIIKRLNKELEAYKEPNKQGFTKAQMGSATYRDLLDEIEKYKNYEKTKGYDFKQLRKVMNSIGNKDYQYRKAVIYRENILNELEKLSKSSKSFRQLYNYFKEIKNPLTFYNKVKKSDSMMDFFLWYQQPDLYGNFDSSDELAEYIIEQYN